MFEQKGVVTIRGSFDEDTLLEAALEVGADGYEGVLVDEDTPGVDLLGNLLNLESMSEGLKTLGYTIHQVETRWIPSTTVDVTDPDQARSLLKMMDALEDLDDVQSVTANFEMAEALMDIVCP
jgi:transcriptional/translational regulatory protein YebC/TACO1